MVSQVSAANLGFFSVDPEKKYPRSSKIWPNLGYLAFQRDNNMPGNIHTNSGNLGNMAYYLEVIWPDCSYYLEGLESLLLRQFKAFFALNNGLKLGQMCVLPGKDIYIPVLTC